MCVCVGRRKTNVLFEDGALLAVVRVGDARPAAHDAAALRAAVVALVAHAHERARAHERVAHHAAPVALFADAADPDARLLPAHDQVWVVLCCHTVCLLLLLLPLVTERKKERERENQSVMQT